MRAGVKAVKCDFSPGDLVKRKENSNDPNVLGLLLRATSGEASVFWKVLSERGVSIWVAFNFTRVSP